MKAHNIKCWAKLQKTRQLDWACKVAQKHEGRWTHTAARWQPESVRVKGRPKTRWHDVINAYLTLATGDEHTCDDWIETLTDVSFGREHRETFTVRTKLASRSDVSEGSDDEPLLFP